jgi:hypothetical protein
MHNLSFFCDSEYEEEGLLSGQFAAAETVSGTQQLHAS